MEELDCRFEVVVDKDDFKFNCAHFVAFQGFRERLHGHNYHVVVRLVGSVRVYDAARWNTRRCCCRC
jgi:6-pyruvoyltetrahydropterin/6-carboxytetrahydropterin synthase